MDPHAAPSPAEFAFTLAVSCEPAFADAVRSLASRAGTLAGCSDDTSAKLGACVGGIFDALIAGGVTHATDIAVDVHGNARLVQVALECPRQGRASVDAAIEVPALRALVDRVECAEAKGRTYCCVTQQVHA